MDDRFVELGEAAQEAMLADRLAKTSRDAMPDTDLKPHQYRVQKCVDCEDDLPELRKQKGFLRCTPCQTEIEVEKKRQFA